MSSTNPLHTQAPFSGRERLWVITSALLILSICLILSAWRGFWIDEYYTLQAVRLEWGEMIRERIEAGHSPVYFFYAKLFYLLGEHPVVWRASSAVAAGVALVGMAFVLRALELRKYLPILWLLGPVFPYWLETGSMFRYQMPLLATGIWLLLAVIRFSRDFTFRNGVAVALLTALIVWIHHTAHLYVIALLIWLMVSSRSQWGTGGLRWRNFGLRLVPLLAGQASCIPLTVMTSGHVEEMRKSSMTLRYEIEILLTTIFGDLQFVPDRFDFSRNTWLAVLSIAFLAGLAMALFRCRKQSTRPAAQLIVSLVLVYLILTFITPLLFDGVKLYERYLVCFSVTGMLVYVCALGMGLDGNRERVAIRGLQGILFLLLVAQSISIMLNPGDGHREAIRWMLTHRSPDMVLIGSRAMQLEAQAGMQGNASLRFPALPLRPKKIQNYRNDLMQAIGEAGRGLAVEYTNPAPLVEQLHLLQQEGKLAGVRAWRLSGSTQAAAFITDPAYQDWLKNLPGPAGSLLRIVEE